MQPTRPPAPTRARLAASALAGLLALCVPLRPPAAPRARPGPAWFEALRPAPALGRVAARKLTLAGETREALPGWQPLDLPLDVPARATLELAAAVRCAEGELCSGAVRFEARVAGRARPLARFRLDADWREDRPESLPIQGRATRWHVARVPLDDFAGRRLNLELRALDARGPSRGARPAPVWAVPRLLAPARERLNVLLVSIDTLRADRLSAAGYARATSPHIDRLAADGLRFTQAITTAPWTTPAHMSLFTGLYPSTHRVTTRPQVTPVRRLSASVPTLAELLRAHGYATQAWTGGGTLGAGYGFDQGFEVYEEGALKLTPAARADVLARLGELSVAPFFFFVHTFEVHAPYTRTRYVEARLSAAARADWQARFDLEWRQRPGRRALAPDAPLEGPAGALSPAALARRQALLREGIEGLLRRHGLWNARSASDLYDGGVHAADDFVGELVAALRRLGLHERTLVIVTSDHGEEFGEHDPARFWDAHCQPLYDELLRVPLIVRLPGGPRGVSERQVGLVDVAPTVLDALGLPVPVDMQGHSLLRPDARRESLALAEATCSGPERKALRGQGVKYVAGFDAGADDGVPLTPRTQQLFDLSRDPGERRDLAASDSARADALRATLLARVRELRGRARGGESGALDAEALERLRALGYVR